MTPPVALRPNSVPCGPFSTAICAMSSSWRRPSRCCGRYTPSIYSATGFSTTLLDVPTPRIDGWNDPAVVRMLSPGAIVFSWSELVIPRAASSGPDAAVTAIGTRWRFSARFCAVTTISCRPSPAAGSAGADAVAGGGPNCANAGADIVIARSDAQHRLFFMNQPLPRSSGLAACRYPGLWP